MSAMLGRALGGKILLVGEKAGMDMVQVQAATERLAAWGPGPKPNAHLRTICASFPRACPAAFSFSQML